MKIQPSCLLDPGSGTSICLPACRDFEQAEQAAQIAFIIVAVSCLPAACESVNPKACQRDFVSFNVSLLGKLTV